MIVVYLYSPIIPQFHYSNIPEKRNTMKQTYSDLRTAFEAYQQGTLTSDKLKPIAAPFGIYEQRNGLFMLRIRVTGGVISYNALKGIADLLEREGGTVHLTSRQDIQLHDVPAEKAARLVEACDLLGLPFKGGGGNTYRNILASARSGIAQEGLFDVYPYAVALNQTMKESEKAFQLPRKLKIGVFASEQERLSASVQDLGFLATRRDGQDGFTVYAGGGMGRDSAIGITLFDFLPVTEVLRVAVACMELFHDHGDRTNRNQARIRYLLKRLGQEDFKKLFSEYYAEVQKRLPPLTLPTAIAHVPASKNFSFSNDAMDSAAYDIWKAIAVLPTRFGDEQVSVRIFVPYGNLKAAELRVLADLALQCGSEQVNLLTTQDLLIPIVHRSCLPQIFDVLKHELAGIDLLFNSYKGHLVTCVGATVCKIGMVDSSAVADAIAQALDHYLPADTPEKLILLRLVADEVRISGCPNACSGHPMARLGIGCINQKVEGEIRPYAQLFCDAGVTNGQPHLSVPTGDLSTIEALVPRVVDLLTSWAHLSPVGKRFGV
jgi:sulfite reductase beta subunit-like hemoprotein